MNARKFLRPEVVELSGCTIGQIRYLERLDLVVPERVWGEKKRPDVYYSWPQLLEIRAIGTLRESISLQSTRIALTFLRKIEGDPSLRDKHLVVFEGGDAFWVKRDWSDFGPKMALQVARDRIIQAGRCKYTMIVIPAILDLESEAFQKAKNSKTIDFQHF